MFVHQNKPNVSNKMTFEEWWESRGDKWHWTEDMLSAEQGWDHQQECIDELNECLEQALSDLKYWEEKAMNLEYDKTLTGNSAV